MKDSQPYAWTCLRCGQANGAGQPACEACGLPANFTTRQLGETTQQSALDETLADDKTPRQEKPLHPALGIALVCLFLISIQAYNSLFGKANIETLGSLMIAACAIYAAWKVVRRKDGLIPGMSIDIEGNR
jgi:ribosomal protein L37E